MMTRNSMLLDLAAAAIVGAAAWFAWAFAQKTGWVNTVIACAFAFGGARIAYEMTINRRSVPTIASAPAVRRQVAQLIAADWAKRDIGSYYNVFDLGSGRGELARAIAKAVPQARVTGIELALVPHWQSKLRQRFFGPLNLIFARGDFFVCGFGDASAVVLFLGKLTVPAGDKLLRELAPGSIVISNDFELGPNWGTPKTIGLHTPFKTVLYIYRR